MYKLSRSILTKITRSYTNTNSAMSSLIKVTPVPCFRDNYAYFVQDTSTGTTCIIDGAQPTTVLKALPAHNISPSQVSMILTTHKHSDHSGGNADLYAAMPHTTVYMSEGIPDEEYEFPITWVKDGDVLQLGNTKITAIKTVGHTMNHVCYHFTNGDESVVFTGDCVFIGGCGRLFEGTADNMFASMQRLKALPPHTKVYTGHEYTVSNYKFACAMFPEDKHLAERLAWASQTTCTQPSTIEEECKSNVFMRAESAEILADLRKKKDSF